MGTRTDTKFKSEVGEWKAKFDDLLRSVDDRRQETVADIIKLGDEIRKEKEERGKSLHTLQTEIAAEHLQREQDESVILNMLESFTHQLTSVNQMCASIIQ